MKAGGHVRRQPVAGRGERSKTRHGPICLTDLRHHMPDRRRLFELLRERPLLLHILTPAPSRKALIDIGGTARCDQLDPGKIDPRLVAGVFEHGRWAGRP